MPVYIQPILLSSRSKGAAFRFEFLCVDDFQSRMTVHYQVKVAPRLPAPLIVTLQRQRHYPKRHFELQTLIILRPAALESNFTDGDYVRLCCRKVGLCWICCMVNILLAPP